jgi:hypothetical protein
MFVDIAGGPRSAPFCVLKPTNLIYKYATLFVSRYAHAWQQLLCQFPARQLTAILSPTGSSTAGENYVMSSFMKLLQ